MNVPLLEFVVSLVLKATFLLAAGLLLAAAIRRQAAELRHLALLITIGSAVMLPLALAVMPRWSVPLLPPLVASADPQVVPARTAQAPLTAAPAALTEATASRAAGEQAPGLAPSTPTPQSSSRLPVFAIIWIVGAFAVAVRIAAGQWRLWRIAGRASTLDGTWRPLLGEEQARMGVRKRVRLLASDATATPVTWGVRSP